MGDFNLDASMDNRLDYRHREQLRMLSEFVLDNNLLQTVEFKTWPRTVNGIKKDHIYVTNPAIAEIPIFAHHLIVQATLSLTGDKLFIKSRAGEMCQESIYKLSNE